MLAMKPTPQESFSSDGSYRPSAAGRNVCFSIGCAESVGFDAATDSPGATMFSRSNSDRLIRCVLSINKAGRPHRQRRSLGVVAPTGPLVVLREPQFLKFRLAAANPVPGARTKIKTVLLS